MLKDKLHDKLQGLDEGERLLYLSAKEVQRSRFWEHLLSRLDGEAASANAGLLTNTMKGDTTAALISACQIQGYNWVLMMIQGIIHDIEFDPDQGEEI